MTKFIKGIKLSEMFFNEIVKKIIDEKFPNLKYSSGLIDFGSEVLGFDTERSRDHDWGPRLMLFVSEKDFEKKDNLINTFSKKLPTSFRGYSTNFHEYNSGTKILSKIQIKKGQSRESIKINHRIEVFSIQSFFYEYLNINPNNDFTIFDWLTFSEQKLRTIQSGKIFHDQINIKKIQEKLKYYPKDIWLYLLASEWTKISEEEPFVGRCGSVDDEIGSKIIATRIIHTLMRLCFLMEKKYAPYSKWFGTAFNQLNSSKILNPIFQKIISSENWEKREFYLSQAYEFVAKKHNNLKITSHISEKVSKFHDRPYLVINAMDFSEKIKKQIKNKSILNIKYNIGSVNQVSNSVTLLENNELLDKMKNLYIN